VKYLILIYHNPATRKIWEGLSEAQRAEGLQAYAALKVEVRPVLDLGAFEL
jgi:hypothetical protein